MLAVGMLCRWARCLAGRGSDETLPVLVGLPRRGCGSTSGAARGVRTAALLLLLRGPNSRCRALRPEQVCHVTGSKVLRILKKKGLAPEIPEDLYCLIKKAVSVRRHLDKFRQDKDAKFRLILIESRIHRLSRYYKEVKGVPPNFKYEAATASTLVA